MLRAKSQGILDDVDMTKVEKLILDPNRDKRYGVSYEDVASKLLKTEEINSSLMAAVREGDVDRVKELIAEGGNVNARNEHGETALMAAAQHGHTVCIDQLLQSNAQLNITDTEGNTALVHAILDRKVECVKKLITAGANANIGTVPPLISSIRLNVFNITNELLMAGADVNGKCEGSNTALIEAVQCSKTTIVQSLLLQGVDINAENTDGDTAIHLAATRGYQEFKRQQMSWPKSPLEFAMAVNMHLKGGDLSNEIDLEPPEYQKPYFHILKMLLAAGAEMEGIDISTPDLHLKSIVRNYIREHLKKTHPKRNLYVTVKELCLPGIFTSYLLFDKLRNPDDFDEMISGKYEHKM